MRYTLHKSERLHSRKEIDGLFARSNALFVYPFKILYQTNEGNGQAQVLFTMSHKKFKRAHQRNAVKRQMKECYRLQKHSLLNSLKINNLNAKIALIYVADELIPHQEIKRKMKNGLHRIKQSIEQELKTKTIEPQIVTPTKIDNEPLP